MGNDQNNGWQKLSTESFRDLPADLNEIIFLTENDKIMHFARKSATHYYVGGKKENKYKLVKFLKVNI